MSAYDFKNQNTTLVHICCSVDSHHFLTELLERYPHKNFCGFFYNPNIHPFEEYEMRLSDVKRSCEMLGIPLIVGEYHCKEWLEGSKGLECEPEKGERCGFCFDFRLRKSAEVAHKIHCVEFTSTLLASPLKAQEELFSRGEKIAQEAHVSFLAIDVRSKGGTKIQGERAKSAKLYRQNYCGCLYALKQQREKSQKIPFELFSTLNIPKEARNLPALRLRNFKRRTELERENQDYKIVRHKVQCYRLLKGLLTCKGEVIPSFICNHSFLSRVTKSHIDFWNRGVGYADKEGILLLEFESFAEFLGVKDFWELLREGLSDEIQLALRYKLYPKGFLASPIVIVEQKLQEFCLEIVAQVQEEILEDFIPLTSSQESL